MREVLEPCDVGVDADVIHPSFDHVELGEAGAQPFRGAHHTGVLGHGVADRALQRAHVLPTVRSQQVVDLGPRLRDGLRRSPLCIQR